MPSASSQMTIWSPSAAWFAEFDAAAWDRQFERDVAEGRLDALADEALRNAREGRCTDL